MSTECEAIRDRKALTAQIRMACIPHIGISDLVEGPGTEEALLNAMSVLQGIVNEYQDGGDQMVENCTCGEHVPDQEVTVTIPYDLTTLDLKIDSAAKGAQSNEELQQVMMWMEEEELPRILTSTVLLHQAGAGTIGECLRTAIIWERG
jgi:hypothetical protein